MKNSHFLFTSFIFFLLSLISSCNAQDKSSLSQKTDPKQVQNNTNSTNKEFIKSLSPILSKQNTLPDSASKIGEYVREVFQDKNGHLWFGTLERGLARFDGRTLSYFSTKDGLAGNQINGIAEDKNGHLWLATTNGISKYDGKTFTNFNHVDGLFGHDIGPLYEDKFGNIWIASKNQGAYRYDGKSFTNYRELTGIAAYNCIQSILEDKTGKLWFGFSGGLFRFDEIAQSFVHISPEGPW